MRKAFIAFGIIAFLVYCWASVAYQNEVDVPKYKLVEVDLLGGRTRAEWDANSQARFQRLMELEGKQYQLPVDAAGEISPDRALASDDFTRYIAAAPAGQPVMMKVRDTSAFYSLLSHKYLLRDSIDDPGDPDGPPLYLGGQPLDKKMLDDLNARGYGTITVTGHGSPVGFQFGTSIMIAIIFLTLVAALKPIIWQPFMALLDKRTKELEMGAEAERQNQIESARYMEEEKRRHGELYREIQEIRMRGQRETAKQAGLVVKEARDKEKQLKLRSLKEIGESAASAREKLAEDVPALAEAVADALTPGKKL